MPATPVYMDCLQARLRSYLHGANHDSSRQRSHPARQALGGRGRSVDERLRHGRSRCSDRPEPRWHVRRTAPRATAGSRPAHHAFENVRSPTIGLRCHRRPVSGRCGPAGERLRLRRPVSVFADSSALVKLYVAEFGHEAVRAGAGPGPLVIATIARAEVPAALWGKSRTGELSA